MAVTAAAALALTTGYSAAGSSYAYSEAPRSNKRPGYLHGTDGAGTYHAEPRPGRNDPCSCGSGKKSKKCPHPYLLEGQDTLLHIPDMKRLPVEATMCDAIEQTWTRQPYPGDSVLQRRLCRVCVRKAQPARPPRSNAEAIRDAEEGGLEITRADVEVPVSP